MNKGSSQSLNSQTVHAEKSANNLSVSLETYLKWVALTLQCIHPSLHFQSNHKVRKLKASTKLHYYFLRRGTHEATINSYKG